VPTTELPKWAATINHIASATFAIHGAAGTSPTTFVRTVANGAASACLTAYARTAANGAASTCPTAYVRSAGLGAKNTWRSIETTALRKWSLAPLTQIFMSTSKSCVATCARDAFMPALGASRCFQAAAGIAKFARAHAANFVGFR